MDWADTRAANFTEIEPLNDEKRNNMKVGNNQKRTGSPGGVAPHSLPDMPF